MRKILLFVLLTTFSIYVSGQENNSESHNNFPDQTIVERSTNYQGVQQKDYTEYISMVVTVFVSGIVSIFTCFVTLKNKKRDIKMTFANNIHTKRIEVYPKLHVITDKLGASIRNNSSQIDIALHESLLELADWDANYAIFAGVEVTKYICHVRRILEKSSNSKDYDHNLLMDSLLQLEKALKDELGIFYTESFEGNGKYYSNKEYQDKIEELNTSAERTQS